jgi:hypothetical protein
MKRSNEHVFKDGGNGWRLNLQVISNVPITSEIKKLFIDISEKISQINANSNAEDV